MYDRSRSLGRTSPRSPPLVPLRMAKYSFVLHINATPIATSLCQKGRKPRVIRSADSGVVTQSHFELRPTDITMKLSLFQTRGELRQGVMTTFQEVYAPRRLLRVYAGHTRTACMSAIAREDIQADESSDTRVFRPAGNVEDV